MRCVWCSNPELLQPTKQVLHYRNKCQKCDLCVRLSQGTITRRRDGLHIDRVNCTRLAEIAALCPGEAYEEVGQYYSPAALSALLLKDEVFYRKSAGGVTFSGGEAGLYPEYLIQVAQPLKKANIHLLLDTAGYWQAAEMKALLPYLDLIYYDIKAYDPRLHLKLTGVDNALILDNLRWLVQQGKTVVGRLPLVPGYNDDLADLRWRLQLLTELKIKQADLLYYHELGSGKYQALGLPYPLPRGLSCPQVVKQEIVALVSDYDLAVNYLD